MPNWLQNLLSPQLLVPFAIVAFSVLGSVAKQVQERRAARTAMQERQRRQMEALRTGRSEDEPERARASAPAASPEAARQRRLQELAERRRAQLEEIRKRQLSGTPVPAPTTIARTSTPARPRPAAPSRPMPAPARPVPRPPVPAQRVPTPRAPAHRPQPQRPQPVRPTAQQQGSRPTIVPSPRPTAASTTGVTQVPDRLYSAADAPVSRTEVGAGAADVLRAAPAPGKHLFGSRGLVGVSADDLRRAIVLREVLGAPVALRD